jgi:hypothetical protein
LKPAKPTEYQYLLDELISIGYDDLEIVRKFSKNSLNNRLIQFSSSKGE